jgi:hypothetical protein
LNAPQYLTGKVLAEAAANYIRTRLGGKAKVVLLTHDSLQFLAPRFAAKRDTLREIPGVTIVADISPVTVNETGGQATMETILLAQPNVDVVLGADTVVLGALAALRAAGKARDDQFLGGIDGEPKAVAEIKKGDPTRPASVSHRLCSDMRSANLLLIGSRANRFRKLWMSSPKHSRAKISRPTRPIKGIPPRFSPMLSAARPI